MQTQTSNTLHNAIMEAGSKDRPPMLAPGNYVQWKSRIKRYIDTKPNHELIHHCLQNPPYKFKWADMEILIFEGSHVIRTESQMETYKTVSQDIHDQLNAEAEAVQIILTGIDNDIYSTVDACPNALNVQFLLQLQPKWQRFVTLVKQSQELKIILYHKLYDILEQHQHEVNEIRAKRLARVANPLSLVAQQQPVYHPQNHPTHYTQNSSTKSQQAVTRTEEKQLETVGSMTVQKSRIQCYNYKEFGHVARECQKPKRAKDAAYHKEKMLLCKQEEARIQLNAEQTDWRDDTDDDELEDQELEAHYMYMAKIQEVSPDAADSGPIFDDEPLQKVSNNNHYNVFAIESEHPEQSKSIHDTYSIQQDAHNLIIDSLDMNYDREEINHNDDDNDLANEQMKDKLSAHQETISILSQQKETQIKLYKTREDKELDKVIALENKVKVLDNIVYKIGQTVQTMNMLNNKCRTSFTKPEFLKKAQRTNPRLYDIDEVTNLQCDYLELLEKCECLEIELSKKNLSKEFRKEREQYFEIQNLKAQLQDKCIIIIIRQPNAFKSQRPSILGKPTTFSNSFKRKDFSKSKSVTQNNVSNDFSKPVITQTLPPNKKSILKNMNVLAPGMYKVHTKSNQARTSQLPQDSRKTNKRVSFSTGVITTTSVSRPQLKSNPMGDRVIRNNSQGKKLVDPRRSVKFSKNKTSVTACNDSLNAKTLNVNFVCATCNKCVLNEKHDICVLNSVAKSLKKTVDLEYNQKPRNITRKLYECVSKTCSWWYPKFTPSGYKWKPKSDKENVNLNTSMPLGSVSRTANILEHMTYRSSTVSNTPLSSNSFAARRDCLIHRTVKFGNDQIAPILGYGDLVQGAVTIKRVYYVKVLNHNLFSVGQFCYANLEVAFRKSTCFIRDLKGNDLLI
nr:hypothetical protein [Tanacetum cinerariifolium]